MRREAGAAVVDIAADTDANLDLHPHPSLQCLLPPSYTDLVDLLPKAQVRSAVRLGLCLAPNLDRDSWSRLVSQRGADGRADFEQSGHADRMAGRLAGLAGSEQYRGQITEYARAAGLASGTLRDAKLVCSRIPVSCRRDTLSWSHHCEIGKAFKDLADIERWLGIAEKGGLSKSDLRKRIRCHFAKSGLDANVPIRGAAEFAPFSLLRELRAVGRLIRNHSDIWTELDSLPPASSP